MPTLRNTTSLLLGTAICVLGALETARGQQNAAGRAGLSWSQVMMHVETHFQTLGKDSANDLIMRGDVLPVLRQLEQLGWNDATHLDLVEKLLNDGEFLARELQSPPGRQFLQRVGADPLIYDRLDRVSRMPGGQQLIHDLIRLPDGHRYAKQKVARGAPSMTDFLPKGPSGKAPRVPDLEKPTGRLYTVQHFWKALEESFQKAARAP